MRARVTTAFNCVRSYQGEVEPWFYQIGEEIETSEAHQAVEEGLAEWITPPTEAEKTARPRDQVLQPVVIDQDKQP